MITVEHLTKYYGDHLAVEDVSFQIEQGHVYGFLGPNGAGKSTTMNIITGCLSATAGSVKIDGHDIFDEPDQAKKCIGYLPEHPPLYMNETPMDYLHFVGEAKGLRGQALQEQINSAMARTGIEKVKYRRISQLSKGYRQRVGIAQALLGNPKVIILDEPTVGLDPIQIIEIRELILELGKTHTVIFSSHILSEVQAICDRILMIAGGHLVAFGTPEELQNQLLSPNEIQLTTDASEGALRALLGNIPAVTGISAERKQYTLGRIQIGSKDIYSVSGEIFHAFATSEFTLYELTLKRGNLEDVFLELSESAPDHRNEENAEETEEEA